jgi:DNA-binding NtrC family response regulator
MRGAAPSVLLVDDDRAFLDSTRSYLGLKGAQVAIASSVREAVHQVERGLPLDLMLVDISLPDGSGLDVLDRLDPTCCGDVIVVTGHPQLDTALRAMRLRVDDYLTKPIDRSHLERLLQRAALRARLRQSRRRHPDRCGELLGASPVMRRLFDLIERVAPTESTVLLHGESGTGKELAARAVHAASGRHGPFVAVNCGAIPADLLGSQLFGHERGSFTGAVREHAGFFEQAQHGTLFLDEITEMPVQLQTYLLRILETRELTRLGAHGSRRLDVRVVAACNRDPGEAVRDGHLREDLYYRLSDFPIAIPPLRARNDDAVLLAEHFLRQLNARYETQRVLSPGSLDRIRAYDWPGNVRELRHVVQRGYVLAEGERVDVLPEAAATPIRRGPGWRWSGQTLAELEREAIEQALERCGNDKTRAARMLGVSVKTIYNKLVRYQQQARQPG